MKYKLSAKAKAAKKKRDLAAAKTPRRRRMKAENQRKRRRVKDKSKIKGKDICRAPAVNYARVTLDHQNEIIAKAGRELKIKARQKEKITTIKIEDLNLLRKTGEMTVKVQKKKVKENIKQKNNQQNITKWDY